MTAPDSARHAEIGLCVLLAAADGDVSDQEVGALSSRLGSILGDEYPAIALGVIVEDEISRMSQIGPDRYIHTLVERLPESRRDPALFGALRVAAADGLAPEEESMFRDVATELGIAKERVEEMLTQIVER